jgi:hypothetical protein
MGFRGPNTTAGFDACGVITHGPGFARIAAEPASGIELP